MLHLKRFIALLLVLMLFAVCCVTASAQTADDTSLPFEGCALIGDSISDGLRLHAARKRKEDPSFLGGLQFLTATSYNLKYASASKPKKYLKYNGKSMRPQDALQAMGAKTVFIMLGMNDIFRDFEDSIKRYETLIANIRAKNPEIEICVLGVTPVVYGKEKTGFTNSRVDQFNALLSEMAASLDCHYTCFNSLLRDKNGGLKSEYSSDKFVHLKNGAFTVYAEALEDALEIMQKQASLPNSFTWLTSDFFSLYPF